MKKKILLVDDDRPIIQLIAKKIEGPDYETRLAENGQDAFGQLDDYSPDLVLLDLNMPVMDGFAFLKKFRALPEHGVTPVIVFSALRGNDDISKAFDYGADNYIVKPAKPDVVRTHIENTFNVITKFSSLNPLTKLPGNDAITEEVNKRLYRKHAFAFCYIDLDNFKAYNDYYGFERGDQVLLHTAKTVRKTAGRKPGNFIGHIGGDDFVALLDINEFETQLQEMITLFDEGIVEFYTGDDRQRGFIETADRQGETKRFGFVSLSIGVVRTDSNEFHSLVDISDSAIEVKKKAKSMQGSHYYVDQRRHKIRLAPSELKQVHVLLADKTSYNIRIVDHYLTPIGFTLDAASVENGQVMNSYIKHEPAAVFLEAPIDAMRETISAIRSHERTFHMPGAYIVAILKEDASRPQLAKLVGAGVDSILAVPLRKEIILQKTKEFLHSLQKRWENG